MPRGKRRKSRTVQEWFARNVKYVILGLAAVAAVALAVVAMNSVRPAPSSYGAPATVPTIEPTTAPPAPPESTVAVERGDAPLRVLFVGDSLTGSLFASTEGAGFRPTMVRDLEGSGDVVETEGFRVNASTSEVDGLADIGTDQDLAIIELGTNDVGKTSVDAFTTDYHSMLARIRETSPDVEFICAGVWRPASTAAKYDAVIRSECEAVGGAFRKLSDLEAHKSFRGPAGKTGVYGGTSDNFHPNDDGYAAIADRLLAAVVFS